MTSVLVVEPDRIICDFVAEALQSDLLASVKCVHSGSEGLHAIQGGCFDLAIIDVRLPQISGFDLAAKAANRNIPTLLCSGHPDALLKLQGLDLPHLSKPFSMQQLIHASAQVIVFSKENVVRMRATIGQAQTTMERLSIAIADTDRLIAETRRLLARFAQPRGVLNMGDRVRAFEEGYSAATADKTSICLHISRRRSAPRRMGQGLAEKEV